MTWGVSTAHRSWDVRMLKARSCVCHVKGGGGALHPRDQKKKGSLLGWRAPSCKPGKEKLVHFFLNSNNPKGTDSFFLPTL